MSTYIERYCPTHLEWDDDTDNPAEACPECVKEGLFVPRAKLEAELSTLRAERGRIKKALEGLVKYVDDTTCTHVNRHRGGVIWTICDDCGEEWADDEGGFKPYKDSPPLAFARAALAPRGPEGEG